MRAQINFCLMLLAVLGLAPETLQARYLNPSTGRFQTMDSYEGSIQDPPSLHKYLYCHGNPANRTDPSGFSDTSAAQQSGTLSMGSYISYSFAQTAARFGLKVTFDIVKVGLMIDKGLLYAEFAALAVPLGAELTLQTIDNAFVVAERVATRWEKNSITVIEGPGTGVSATSRGKLFEGVGLLGEKGYQGGNLEVFDGQSPKGVSFSAGTVGLSEGPDLESRYLAAIRNKLAQMDQAAGVNLQGTSYNGEAARINAGSTKIQMGMIGIPENHAFLLRSTTFRAEIARYRQMYQSWVMVTPIRNWRMLWRK